jgi:hypothetical protein
VVLGNREERFRNMSASQLSRPTRKDSHFDVQVRT